MKTKWQGITSNIYIQKCSKKNKEEYRMMSNQRTNNKKHAKKDSNGLLSRWPKSS